MRRLVVFLSVVAAMTLACSVTLSAQSKVVVKGKIVDVNGEPLIGVAVIEQNTSNGVMTDADGAYVINASKSGSLLFDYMGYKQELRPIGGKTVINVTLEEDRKIFDNSLAGTTLSTPSFLKNLTVSKLVVEFCVLT